MNTLYLNDFYLSLLYISILLDHYMFNIIISKYPAIALMVCRVADAENIPIEDQSVDLVTIAMALHLFDQRKCYNEVHPCKYNV